jgi:regulator of sirC expression with transglutaminase-like and TPR domain
MLFYGTVDRLLALLSGKDDSLELDRAALELARIEYPGLEPTPFLELLDSYAFELGGRLGDGGPAEFVELAGDYLFNELGFSGNAQDYYDPKNSCLNDVLTRRTGIPIRPLCEA